MFSTSGSVFVRFNKEYPIYITNELNIGPDISIDKGTSSTTFNIAKAARPPKIESMAATLLLRLNTGSNPNIIGIAIGPNKAANQVTIKPITPPNRSELNAIIIVNKIKLNVVILAILSIAFELNTFTFFTRTGKISLVITDDIVLASDAVIDKVFENNDATNKPKSPGGKNFIAINEYDCSGFAKSGKKIGAANIGNSKINGHAKYRNAENIAAFLASFPD